MRAPPPALARLLAVFAATVVVVAFFLPWMEGEGELRFRAFSGFDFARLVRNFEITAGSTSGTGRLRATAIALYVVPAIAVNGALAYELAQFFAGWRAVARVTMLCAAVYVLAVLASLLTLSILPVNDFENVVGVPSYGLALSGGGALVLGWIGLTERHTA